MIPYFGRYSIKMFIRGKPIRFGYKLWALCGADGYPYKLMIYTGRDQEANHTDPLGTRVVNHMIQVVEQHSDVKRHHFYFDNFFGCYDLFKDLSDRNAKATGTIRECRTAGANKILISSADMKRRERGSFDYCSDGAVYMVKWHDNSIVTMASNCLTHDPVQQANRRVRGQSNVSVQQPNLVKKYNESMGGVDLFDRLLASYRPAIRGKKWWWPLFINALNAATVAAWCAHKQVAQGPLDHLSFRKNVAL